MSRIFSIFGKLILGAIFLIAVLWAGYHIGTNKNLTAVSPQMTNTSDIASSPTPTYALQPTKLPVVKTIIGGLSEGTAFRKYSVDVPNDWHEKREITSGVSEKLTFSKDGYSLTIYQAPMDGSICLYDDDKPIEGPSQKFSNFVELKGKETTFRRSFNDSESVTLSQTICEKKADTFGTPTQFGSLSVIMTLPENETLTAELDSIIQSLKKN